MTSQLVLSSSSDHFDEKPAMNHGSSHSIDIIDMDTEEEDGLLENVINDSCGDGHIFETSNRSFSLTKESRTNGRDYRQPFNRKKVSYQWDGGFGGASDLFDECLEVSDCSSTCSSTCPSKSNEPIFLLEFQPDRIKKEPEREHTAKICREFGLTKLTSLVPSFQNSSGTNKNKYFETDKIRDGYDTRDECYRSLSSDAISSMTFHGTPSLLHNSNNSTNSLKSFPPPSMNSKKPARYGSVHYHDRPKARKWTTCTTFNDTEAPAAAPLTKVHKLIGESKKKCITSSQIKETKESGTKMDSRCPAMICKTTGMFVDGDHALKTAISVVPQPRPTDCYTGFNIGIKNCMSPISCVTFEGETNIDSNDHHSCSSTSRRSKPSKVQECRVHVPLFLADTQTMIHPSSSQHGTSGGDAPPRIPRRNLSPVRKMKTNN